MHTRRLISQVKEISEPIPRKVYPFNEPLQKSLALPIFHVFTSCETVSSFSINGKKTAWKTWGAHQGFSRTFTELSRAPELVWDDNSEGVRAITSTSSCINGTRQLLFTCKGRQMQGLPPTKAALEQHIKRAVLQGGHDWGQAMIRDCVLQSPGLWVCTCPDKWEPLGTILP